MARLQQKDTLMQEMQKKQKEAEEAAQAIAKIEAIEAEQDKIKKDEQEALILQTLKFAREE